MDLDITIYVYICLPSPPETVTPQMVCPYCETALRSSITPCVCFSLRNYHSYDMVRFFETQRAVANWTPFTGTFLGLFLPTRCYYFLICLQVM